MKLVEYERRAANKTFFYGLEDSAEAEVFAIPPVPKGWKMTSDLHWQYVICSKSPFPDQGWKIHVTSTMEDAQSMLFEVAGFLLSCDVSFKYVLTRSGLFSKNSKYADRSASGKFIVVYPPSDEEFMSLLTPLKAITDQFDSGPYILNDKQWCDSNVFFRYGGFRRIEKNIDGERHLVIRDKSGGYIPDLRQPFYALPTFIHEPEWVVKHNAAPAVELNEAFKSFRVKGSLHFSNGGGVYLAERDGKSYVLKEGRQKAGLDGKEIDAYTRNRDEFLVLKRLKDVASIVDVVDFIKIWKHNYLVEDYVDGLTLQDFVASNFPFESLLNRTPSASKYAEKCCLIIDELKQCIEETHKKGIAICDLNLSNIIVGNKGESLRVIDLEAARPVFSIFNPSIATRGFFCHSRVSAESQDWFSWIRIVYNLFLPVSPILDIAPRMREFMNSMIEMKFGPEITDFIDKCCSFALRYVDVDSFSHSVPRELCQSSIFLDADNVEQVCERLASGILSNIASDKRALTCGDVTQFHSLLGDYNIANGAYGVLLSLVRCGVSISEHEYRGLRQWVDVSLSYIKDLSRRSDSDFGLFTGITGIATVLDEIGLTDEASYILSGITRATIDDMDDISLYSGLSGVGLQLLSFSLPETLDTLKCVVRKLKRSIKLTDFAVPDMDLGLLTGWSGVSLFLWKYGHKFDDDDAIAHALNLLDVATKKQYLLGLSSRRDRVESAGNRHIPYLDNGSAGVLLLLLEFTKDDQSFPSENYENALSELIVSCDVSHSYDGGLMSGYAGFLVAANAIKVQRKDDSLIRTILHNMNLYLLEDQKKLLFPGRMGYKCSMDYASGAAGVLLALRDVVSSGRWDSWMPVRTGAIHLFRSDDESREGR